ncbi:hypothetical protein QW131_03445 [Roseibium salinum]|nr:hypothetical protein [Roseibium salinum]
METMARPERSSTSQGCRGRKLAAALSASISIDIGTKAKSIEKKMI